MKLDLMEGSESNSTSDFPDLLDLSKGFSGVPVYIIIYIIIFVFASIVGTIGNALVGYTFSNVIRKLCVAKF